MGTLITPWHGAHDIRCNRSQLVSIEFKSDPSYVKHTVHMHQEQWFCSGGVRYENFVPRLFSRMWTRRPFIFLWILQVAVSRQEPKTEKISNVQ